MLVYRRVYSNSLCKWFWSGLNGYLNTEPNKIFGALGITKIFRYLKWRVSLNLIAGYFGGGETPGYISRIHTASIGEDSSNFRYLKCLVMKTNPNKPKWKRLEVETVPPGSHSSDVCICIIYNFI